MENALISTLICTYNAESFISKTLDSVINQDYQNQEILIWDDCSNDNTLEVLYAYQKKDKRIHIFSESKKL
ncbi:MAG: glycosyltransferase [bacterium]